MKMVAEINGEGEKSPPSLPSHTLTPHLPCLSRNLNNDIISGAINNIVAVVRREHRYRALLTTTLPSTTAAPLLTCYRHARQP